MAKPIPITASCGYQTQSVMNKIKNNSVKVIVKPNSSKNEVLGWDEPKQALRVMIAAPAERNKANIALIKFLTREFSKRVRIANGLCRKEKLLFIG